ncbi:MAG: hypothetical protein ACREXG_11605 [Polaromonas sp.]
MNMPLNLPFSRRLFCGLALTTVCGAQAQVAAARQVLDQSMALFERQPAELKAFAPAGATSENLLQVMDRVTGLYDRAVH